MKSFVTKQFIKDPVKQQRGNDWRSFPEVNGVRSLRTFPVSTGIPLLQRKCACGGGCPRCQESSLQTKLKISEPDDEYEQEADSPTETFHDRIADKVMRMPTPVIQRQVEPNAVPNLPMQDIQEPRYGTEATATGRCYTCQLPGGIGVCCYGEGAPMVPECLELGKRIIDNCPGNPLNCLQQAQCAACQCIGQLRGKQYCQCTGIV